MLETTRARLRRRRGRAAVVCAVALLGAAVATAHTSVAGDHMGEAAAMCLAIVAGGAAVAALPALAGPLPRQRPPLELSPPAAPLLLKHAVPHLARGDPSLLQVFQR
jgi:peptidoglycan/LPS O-acetylase OafA/YrhL